ncbi:hypothetical protein DV738_g1540, partial [Chaetothyriales sp. CBS 135597]
MSTFASVVRKPGQKITPRAAPRRNIQRQAPAAAPATLATPATPAANASADVTTGVAASVTDDAAADAPASRTTDDPSAVTVDAGSVSDNPQPQSLTFENPLPTPPATAPVIIVEPSEAVVQVVEVPTREHTQSAVPVVAEERQLHAGTKRSAVEDDQAADDQSNELLSIEDEVIQDLLHRSRTSASAVSELSLSIDRDTDLRLRSRSRQQSSTLHEAAGDQEDGGESRSGTRMDALAAAVLDRPSGPRGRRLYRRGHTPEDAENFEIDADSVQMGELTRDSGLGKRSETGKRLEAEWTEIKERWEDHAANNRQAALNKRAKESEQQKQAAELGAEPPAPMMTIVNNQIVFVEGAREVSFHDNHEQRAEEGAQAAKVDEPIYRYVNQNRIGKKAGRLGGKVVRWDDDSTDLFYKGLRMFGTDFEMIANILFPGKTRKEIKDKFVREERKNHARVIENTRQREAVDLDELLRGSEIGELKDPEQVLREMQAEEEKLRKQYEEKRAHQNGEALASSVLGGRPKQQRKSRQVRKGAKEAPGRAKANRKGKKPMEGVEERIGTIDEVAA